MRNHEASSQRSQLPVCVVTGFLGAGKTSLLNHFMSSGHGLRVGIVVNDFGAIDIDSQLVESVTEDTVSLRNGCICCSMRDDFFAAVSKLVRRENPPEVLVVETSGVSDPTTVVQTLTHPDLSESLRVDAIVSVVDSDSFVNLGPEEARLAVVQVILADLVVLNKADLVDEERLRRLEADVRKLAPRARIFRTEFGRLPIAALLAWDGPEPESSDWYVVPPKPRDSLPPDLTNTTVHEQKPGDLLRAQPSHDEQPHERHDECCGEHTHGEHDGCCGEHQHHHDEGAKPSLSDAFESFSLVIEPQLCRKKLQSALMNLPVSIYRLKGLFHVDVNPDKQLLIQVVGPRISVATVKPWGEKPRASEIVAIGLKGGVDKEEFTSLFESCVATETDGSLDVRTTWRMSSPTSAPAIQSD